MLPEMKISTNERTGEKVKLTSWKSPSDPSIGSFSARISSQRLSQEFIWKDDRPYFRFGPWNGPQFIGAKPILYRDKFNMVQNQDGTTYLVSSFFAHSSHVVLTMEGNTVARYWDSEKEVWEVEWKAVLKGFEPKNTEEWNRQNWTSGCVRRTPLQCGRVDTSGEAGKMDGFLKLNMMKVPDFVEWSAAQEDDCRQPCLQNCSCIAYAIDSDTNGDVRKIVTITVIIGTIFISIFTYLLWRWIAKHKVEISKEKERAGDVNVQ
ncbi:g-type lectin s-receptor-like serine/threonine-protein kinase [Quercus suber]|uniref:G-type lectin s-receptor-like serine/threonine-protein kinase n=1 Tax=Quercus suber TaxID=58331 RepID=A0AAW0KCW2_QUESU